MFSNLGGRLKKIWKGEGAPQEAEKEKTTTTGEAEPELTQEEKEAAEKEDKKLMENITQGKFDLNDYHREISRLVKMAKAKGAFDTVKGTVNKMLGKKEQAQHDQMKQMIVDFESQMTLLNAMTEQERLNPEAFYDHAFKTKQRIVASVNQTVADFNILMQKYEQSRMVYMILHEVKKKGKDIPTETEKVLPFVQEHVHLLSEKDKIRVRKTMKNMQR